jgi:hypothetical protein
MLAQFLANYPAWFGDGYRLFHAHKWGEGAWENILGSDVPKDPSAFVADNDLQIVLDPGSYAPYVHATAQYPIDLVTEIGYLGGATEILNIQALLEKAEENGSPDYRFFEVGIFDNCGDIASVQADTGYLTDNMILYATIDLSLKNVTVALRVDFPLPFKP